MNRIYTKIRVRCAAALHSFRFLQQLLHFLFRHSHSGILHDNINVAAHANRTDVQCILIIRFFNSMNNGILYDWLYDQLRNHLPKQCRINIVNSLKSILISYTLNIKIVFHIAKFLLQRNKTLFIADTDPH